jgi:bacterioferritin
MTQEQTGADLNLALCDNLTFINKGFVQSLCLRFHDSKERARLAYADNLAGTRRLMQLLREMERLGIRPDPDGASGDSGRGAPDLQSKAKDIWLSDMALVTRKLESLRRGKALFDVSSPDGSESPALERLIGETEAFAAELQDRANGIENLGPFDPAQAASQAETNTIEDFLGYVENAEDAYLAGHTDAPLPESDPIFAVLNTVLNNHFLAIDQYFVHAFMLAQWNEKALAEDSIRRSVDEMKGAFRAAQRIIVLGSVPRLIFLDDIRVPYRVRTGSDPLDAIRNDLALTDQLTVQLQRAKALAENVSEARSVDFLSSAIDLESDAKRRLSAQMETLSAGETPGAGSGKFDRMLDSWAAA